jgi:hypothetical protein
MKKILTGLTALTALGLAFAGCSGSGNGSASTILGQVLAPSFKSAPQADLSGQQSVYSGRLGSGLTFTFSAVQNATYTVTTTQSGGPDNLVLDVFSRDGSELKAKLYPSPGSVSYFHAAVSQHVLCLLRPNDPLNTGVNLGSVTVQGTGSFSQSSFSVNIIVAGDDFAGFGAFNDLATTTDRSNLASSLAQRVQALHDANNTAIKITFQGFTLTTAQVKASHPELTDSKGHTICRTQAEQVNSQGYGNIDTGDLDKWGDFGFPSNDPDPNRANGLDVFIVHHFATDGVVGLSPRPGNALKGNGAGTALCVGAFLQQGAFVTPRDLGNMGVVLTHEIGHFLGLQHTTTFSPGPGFSQVTDAIDDGLDDTAAAGDLPSLKANTQAAGLTSIGVGCGCGDEPNIMFYQSIPTQQFFSQKQTMIMKTTLSSMEH